MRTDRIVGMEFEFKAIENFRDLGGFDARYGKTTPGVIYRSADISHGTEEDLAKLKELGIKTILDLKGPALRNYYPSPLRNDPDIKTVEVDIHGGEIYPKVEEDLVGYYLGMLEDGAATRKIVETLVYAPKPLLVHCMAGKDRTGIHMLLLLWANGVDRDTISEDYLLSYDRLPILKAHMTELFPDTPEFTFKGNRKIIDAILDRFIEKYGDVCNYLAGFGIPEDDINSYYNLLGVQEQSAGAVVFHGDRVLVEHMKLGHYSMPKGHVEKGDGGLRHTAIREIKEETGLEATILDGFETSSVYSPKPGHIKEVRWFAATVESTETVSQPEEVQDCYFIEPEDAYRVLSHDSDRLILKKACKFYFK